MGFGWLHVTPHQLVCQTEKQLSVPQTLAMKILGTNISILHGELVGLILALVLLKDTRIVDQHKHRLLTNHLNTVWLVEDVQSGVDQMACLQFMNGQSYYCWLLALTNSSNSPIHIAYTQGHSTKATVEAKLNDEMDFYASSSQRFFKNLLQAPIPTFFDRSDGWIKSNISAYTEA